ncbi:MAG: NapC/NirT family cytochrome c, partial [Propionivibrio sp.]
CPDCHVPKSFGPKMYAKIRASKDVYHNILGTIDTPEKFNAYRLKMAEAVWTRMKETDSRECRGCHDGQSFDYAKQSRRAAEVHQEGLNAGQTCIDCHKGIAHRLPNVEQSIGAEKGGATQEIFHPAPLVTDTAKGK